MQRLLITGSRWWADWSIPYYALAAEWVITGGAAILVSGACPPRLDDTPGADRICEATWERFGGVVEQHPADWNKYGKQAGFIRNREMAELPDVYKCLAFKLNNSNGTANCMEWAQKNGIPVSLFEKWS